MSYEDFRKKVNAEVKYKLQRETFHNDRLSRTAAQADQLVSFGGKRLTPYMREMLASFVPEEKRQDGSYMQGLLQDLRYSRACYASSYREYFLFDFEHLSDRERRAYVCWYELNDYYDQLNRLGRPEYFDDKHFTARRFLPFFRRDVKSILEKNQKNDFCRFLERHGRCIVKPLLEFGGKGIEFFTLRDGESPESVWSLVENRVPFLMEELIEQSPDIAKFYSHSVNTIRYNTFFHDGKLTRLEAVFRIGRGGSAVDNATSGGIYSLVDTETGVILNPARSFKGELFEKHPDTGTQLQGATLPRWNELNALLEELARVVPEQKQVGWDLALSKNGWVMVEANTKPALQRFNMSHGMRPLISDTFGRAIPMWTERGR